MGFRKFVLIDAIMDVFKHSEMLNENLEGSTAMLCHKYFIFQQDNDPKHTSKHAKEFLR